MCSVLGSKVLTPTPASRVHRPGEIRRAWIPDDHGDAARRQFQDYRHSPETLGLQPSCFLSVVNVERFWLDYGEKCIFLIDVALRLCCIPAAAAAGERVFSALAHIWNDNRNRLLMGRAAMLAFVYFNKRVQERIDTVPSEADWLELLDVMDAEKTQV